MLRQDQERPSTMRTEVQQASTAATSANRASTTASAKHVLRVRPSFVRLPRPLGGMPTR